MTIEMYEMSLEEEDRLWDIVDPYFDKPNKPNAMEGIIIEYNNSDSAKIRKADKDKQWPNNDCSDSTLLKYLNRQEDIIARVQFTDEYGVGDGIIIYFLKS